MTPKKTFTILVPTDFSACSTEALKRGLMLAGAFEGKVHLVHVIDTANLVGLPEAALTIDMLAQKLEEGAQAGLRGIVDEADPARKLIQSAQVVHGPPARTIAEEAKSRGADIVVMGTHGRTGLQRLFVGSVAERVLRTAPCDVLVVRVAEEPKA